MLPFTAESDCESSQQRAYINLLNDEDLLTVNCKDYALILLLKLLVILFMGK